MRYLLTILLHLIITSAWSQKDLADSLHRVLDAPITELNKINTLNHLAEIYYERDVRKAQELGYKALELASQKAHYPYGEERALAVLNKIQRRLGNYSIAMELNLRQITLAEKLNDSSGLLDGYTSLGNINSALKNFPDAKYYFEKARVLAHKLNSPELRKIINFKGRIYAHLGEYDSAEFWIRKALEIEQDKNADDYNISYIYNNLGELAYFRNEYTKSVHYYKLSKNLPSHRNTQFGMTYTMLGLAGSYLALGDYQNAKAAALESITISQRHHFRDRTKEAYGLLYQIYERAGNPEQALTCYEKYNIYKDSILSDDRLQYIENLKVYFETERMAQENELLRKDTELKDIRIQKGRSIALVAIVSTASLAGMLIVLLLHYRQKKTTNEILSRYNKTLEDQVEKRTNELVKINMELIKQNNQLEQFGYIIAHNLRAPVARLLGLANIINHEQFSMPADKPVLDKLQHAAKELDSVIYDLNVILDIKKGLQYSFEEIDIEQSFEKVKNILKDKIRDSSAIVKSDFSKGKVCYAIPAYVESILYNLISNAIKYRSKDRPPVIRIFSNIDHDALRLTIRDNGMGIDLEKSKDKVFNLYQRFHDHVEGKGIGLYLVKTQVEALNGSIEIDSCVDEGTTFAITLPIRHQHSDAAPDA